MELQDGHYRGKGAMWELGFTSNGKEQVAVMLQLQGDGFETYRITWYGYFTEAALPITVRALRALGWQGDDLSDLTGLDLNEVELVVKNETYNGKTFPKVQFINALGDGGVALKDKMAPEQAKSFGARMKAQLRALDAVDGRKAKPARPSTASEAHAAREIPPPADAPDDIPF